MAIITISRGTKSGGLKLARCLAERLGYACISREVVIGGAKKYNIMEEDLFERLEKSPSLWQKARREHQRYLIFVQCALIDAVKQDNVVYHGYAGQLFLKGVKHVLKVRLDAPLGERIKAVMGDMDCSPKEAREYIAKVDEQRSRWVKYVYGQEWRDPSLYDMSFYTETLTVESVCELIIDALEREDFRTTENSARRLEDLSLECEVRAALTSDKQMWEQRVKIGANDGVVTLRGIVKNQKLRDAIGELALQVKGVRECQNDITLSTDRLAGGIYGHD